MKKKIKNILKYISIAIVGAFIFMFGLSAQAYRKDSLEQYKVSTNTIEDFYINDVSQQANENLTNTTTGNVFTYTCFNIQSYLSQYSTLNDYIITIPYMTSIYVPQYNNYNDNEYDTAIYYIYSNNTTSYQNSWWQTQANVISNNNYDISKRENGNEYNYISDIANLSLIQTYQYLYIGYYSMIDYDTDNENAKFSIVNTTINFNFAIMNVYGRGETSEENSLEQLKAKNEALNNEINQKNKEITNLTNENETLSNSNETLNTNYNTLQQNYNNLQNLYNGLATNEYTFENLFWSVGSVPMAFLLQSFNVNVLGLNIRAIITGLITALIIIWLIKRLIK